MNRLYLIFGLLLCVTICNAEEYRENIVTADEDRIIVIYEIQYQGEMAKITFLNVEKILSRQNSKRYRKPESIKAVFFDKIANYKTSFIGITPNAITTTRNIRYSKSEKGYFLLENKPTVSFTIVGEGEKMIYIPIYLTYYDSRSKYEIFTGSSDFCIKLNPPITTSTSTDTKNIAMSHTSTEVKIATSDNVVDNEEAEGVYEQIDWVMELLGEQTKLPFSEMLIYEINTLRTMKRDVKDKKLSRAIQTCLMEYDSKKADLEREETLKEEQAKLEAEQKEQEKQLELLAEQKRIAEEQKRLAEEQKKRSLLMTIGGIILAAICFIGSQVLQHFRTLRNQRSMMEMQQDITRRAEAEAKRHAQNYTRRKVSDVVNGAKRGTQNVVHTKVNQSGIKKTKKISI